MVAVQPLKSYAPSPLTDFSFQALTGRFTEDTLADALIASEEGERPKQRAAARHQLIDAACYIKEPEIWAALVKHLTDMSYDMRVSVLNHFAAACPYAYKSWADGGWGSRPVRVTPPPRSG